MEKPIVQISNRINNPQLPPGASLSDSQDDAISVTFTNYSKTQWALDYWGYRYQEGFSGPSSEPSNPLLAESGSQTFAQSQVLSFVDQGPISIYCTWVDNNGYRFGVLLEAHFQMFEIGHRPTWKVSVDQNATPGSKPKWEKNGAGPASTYTWNTSEIPYNIVGTPTSEHTSLSVEIVITDLN